METTINKQQFHDAFKIRPNNFSYEGLNALFEYFTQLEEDCGTEIELDVIAICCEFSEYTRDELEDIYPDYSIADLYEKTQVIEIDTDLFIIAEF